MPCRQRDDQITTGRGQSACRHYQPAIWGARKVRDCTLDLARVAQFDRLYIYAGRRGHRLNYRKLADPSGYGRIPQCYYSRETGCDFFEQFQPFSTEAIFELHEAGGIAARLRQTIDEAGTDWIGDDREHDRHGVRRLKYRSCRRAASGHDDVRRERNQFFGLFVTGGGIAPRKAVVEPYVAALRPAQLP